MAGAAMAEVASASRAASAVAEPAQPGWLARLNTTGHKPAMLVFIGIVVLHWSEHIAQAVQIWVLGWSRPESRGLLGEAAPWLVSSEWLHYAFALVMLVGLLVLRPAMRGKALFWWDVAITIQVWHHLEHLLLLGQAVFHYNLFGAKVPTSILQAMLPARRVEIHLVYNALVTIPMALAAVAHRWPARDAKRPVCSCAAHAPAQATPPPASA